MTQVTYKSEKISTKRVYYSGTDVLREGYCLCYDRTYGTASDAEVGRAYRVVKPATANLKYFAGVVSAADDGRVGPCWITVIEPQPNPGRLVYVYSDQDCTLGVTRLAVADGSYAGTAAGAAGVTVATAMQTVNRAVAPAAVLAQLEGSSDLTPGAAGAVAPTQAALSKPAGSTTGGTHWLQTAALTTAVMGGTSGGTVALEDVSAAGWSGGAAGAKIENNFVRFARQVANIRSDFAKLVTEVNAVKSDLAAVLASLKSANLMANA